MKSVLFSAVALVGFITLAPGTAEARFPVAPIATPTLVEDIACTVRQVRTVRPGGNVVVRTVRSCTPDRPPVQQFIVRTVRPSADCRTVRTRTVRPGGAVVVRSVRRCG
jgi:hypothetical protein